MMRMETMAQPGKETKQAAAPQMPNESKFFVDNLQKSLIEAPRDLMVPMPDQTEGDEGEAE